MPGGLPTDAGDNGKRDVCGRCLGPVHCSPGSHEGRTGAFPRACRQRPVHCPNADPDVPAAAAQGMQRDLHDLAGIFHNPLDLITDRAFKVSCGGKWAQFFQQAGDSVHVPRAPALVDCQNVHAPSLWR